MKYYQIKVSQKAQIDRRGLDCESFKKGRLMFTQPRTRRSKREDAMFMPGRLGGGDGLALMCDRPSTIQAAQSTVIILYAVTHKIPSILFQSHEVCFIYREFAFFLLPIQRLFLNEK